MSFVDDVVGPRTPSLLDPGDKIAIELYSKEELPVVIKSETISDSHRELRDGGRRAWLVLAGAFMVIFMTYGYVNSWGIFQAYYAKNLLRASSSSSM
ncbi:hypothetical protein V5O48_011851 [Marasmius crinis-equi]|uniref:Uncharacterized protein n=1 Tax=Marasmius crinis-equi TaxID=585013 RepID=A0ABR3F4Q5_9AGAR